MDIWEEGKWRGEEEWVGTQHCPPSREEQHLSMGKGLQSCPTWNAQSYAVLKAIRQVPSLHPPITPAPCPGL